MKTIWSTICALRHLKMNPHSILHFKQVYKKEEGTIRCKGDETELFNTVFNIDGEFICGGEEEKQTNK